LPTVAASRATARGFGGARGLAELGVGGVQQVERMFKVAGAFADLVFQHGGALELGIGGAGIIGDLFDPAHQHLGDRQELLLLAIRAVGGVDEPFAHAAGSGG